MVFITGDVSTLDLSGLEVPFHAHYSGVEQITNQRTAAFHLRTASVDSLA